MLQLFLVLHVLGAIAVFGPTFAFPLISGQVAKAPQHGHFAALVMDMIERKIVIPGAIVQGITGVGLITPVGIGVEETWSAPSSNRRPVRNSTARNPAGCNW